jgi:hypothetical protein
MSALFEFQTPTFQAHPDLLKWALHYGRLGWHIFPVPFPTARGCSCWHGQKCPDPGKHPALKGWQKAATADLGQIAKWWKGKHRGYNIGLLTGPQSGVIVLDVDDEEGAYLVAEKGLPPGPVAITGRASGAGRHYFFQHPGYRVKNKTETFTGIDTRGDGGFIVLPPSLHSSGNYYRWEIAP